MNTHVKLPAPLRPPAKIPSRLVWPATVPAQNGTWINPLSGLWSDGTIASGSDFTSNFTTLDLADDATNHLDSPPPRTLEKLLFGDLLTNTPAG